MSLDRRTSEENVMNSAFRMAARMIVAAGLLGAPNRSSFAIGGPLMATTAPAGQRASTQSVARQWDEELLQAIRIDIPRPPVHARNLYHLSVAMWDAWA